MDAGRVGRRMLTMKHASFALFTAVLLALSPHYSLAAPSEFEYKVGTAELANLMFDKSAEGKVKEWAKKHRPELYKLAFTKPEKQAPKPEAKVKGKADGSQKGLVALGVGLSARTSLVLDYYLNEQAEKGWDVFLMSDEQIVFRKKRAKS